MLSAKNYFSGIEMQSEIYEFKKLLKMTTGKINEEKDVEEPCEQPS